MMLWFGKRYLIIPDAAGTISCHFDCCKCCVTMRGSCDNYLRNKKIVRKCNLSWSISSAWLSALAEIHSLNNPWVCVFSWSHLNSLDVAVSALSSPWGWHWFSQEVFGCSPIPKPSSLPALGTSLSLVWHQPVWLAHISAQNPKSSFPSPHRTVLSQRKKKNKLGIFFSPPLKSLWERSHKVSEFHFSVYS